MKKQVYELTIDNYIKEIHVSLIDENGVILEGDKKEFVSIDPPNGLYKPKWNSSEWVEGESEEEKAEREAQQLLESLKPSPSEIANAELEIKVITMLTELEVLQ